MHIPVWDDLRQFLKAEMELFIKNDMRATMLRMCDMPDTSKAVTESRTNVQDSLHKLAQKSQKMVQNKDSADADATASSILLNQSEHSRTPNEVRPQQAWNNEKSSAPLHLQCPLCDGSGIHATYNCPQYKQMDFDQKWRHIKQHKLCQRCLRPQHGSAACENNTCNQQCPLCYNFEGDSTIAYHNSTLCPVRHMLHPRRAQAYEDFPDWN